MIHNRRPPRDLCSCRSSRSNVTGLGPLGFTYDAASQPVAVSGAVSGSYVYDGHLKRVKQVVGGVVTYSVYSSLSGQVAVLDTVGGERLQLISLGPVSVRVPAAGAAVYTHLDHLGSPVAATDTAGAVLWRESFTPFGARRINPAANRDKPGFTGHVDDHATGLTYMQARYYDPALGRFLSNDPVGFTPARPDMFNRYAYAANDPVNNGDPDGRRCQGTGCFDNIQFAREACDSCRRLEVAATLTILPFSPLFAVQAGGLAGFAAVGAGGSYLLEGVSQFRDAQPDGGALLSAAAKGGALSIVGGGITAGALQYADDVAGGIALAVTSNAIALPQVSGIIEAADALRTGDSPAQAYGQAVATMILQVYTLGLASDISSANQDTEDERVKPKR